MYAPNRRIPDPANRQPAILLIRLLAGGVFLWEGLLKFVYPNQGVGRFTKLGFPFPSLIAHFTAVTEITGGLLLLAGLFTRAVAFYFVGEMIIAILSTKVSLFLGTSPLPPPPVPPRTGIWAVLHEVRSEYAQLLTCLFLFLEGAGSISLDNLKSRVNLRKRRKLSSTKIHVSKNSLLEYTGAGRKS